MSSVWYVCKYCKRALKGPKELISHKKIEHPDEFRRDKEKKKQEKKSEQSERNEKEFSPIIVSSSSLTSESKSPGHGSQNGSSNSSPEREKGQGMTNDYQRKITTDIMSTSKLKTSNQRQEELALPVKNKSSPSTIGSNDPTKHNSKPASCIYCDQTFPFQTKMVDHVQRVHGIGRPFQCKYCSKNYKAKSHLADHEYTHIGGGRFRCDYCSMSFLRSGKFREHMAIKHPDQDGTECQPKIKKNLDEKKISYKCKVCRNSFNDPKILALHERQHERLALKDFTQKDKIKQRMKTHQFQCRLCKDTFKSMSAFNDHRAIQHGERVHECKNCHERFKWHTQLTRHMKQDKCPNLESTFVNLNEFKQYSPPGEDHSEPILKVTKTPMNFLNQKRSQPQSTIPSEEATTSNSLEYLTTQVFEGTPVYVCNFCKKVIAKLSSAVEHIRTHTGECPFECSYCHRKFAWKSTFQAHERLHTGERPYKCNLCHKSFISSSAKYVHRKLHHPGCIARASSSTWSTSYRSPTILSPNASQRRSRSSTATRAIGQTEANQSSKYLYCEIFEGIKFHICRFCKNEFRSLSAAKTHVLIHTGERPFQCTYPNCQKRFTRNWSMRKHRDSCHPPDLERQ